MGCEIIVISLVTVFIIGRNYLCENVCAVKHFVASSVIPIFFKLELNSLVSQPIEFFVVVFIVVAVVAPVVAVFLLF